jgi:hypothetical protein
MNPVELESRVEVRREPGGRSKGHWVAAKTGTSSIQQI